MPEAALLQAVEYSNASIYRRDVLKGLHKEKLIEFDPAKKQATLSATGVRKVEQEVPLQL